MKFLKFQLELIHATHAYRIDKIFHGITANIGISKIVISCPIRHRVIGHLPPFPRRMKSVFKAYGARSIGLIVRSRTRPSFISLIVSFPVIRNTGASPLIKRREWRRQRRSRTRFLSALIIFNPSPRYHRTEPTRHGYEEAIAISISLNLKVAIAYPPPFRGRYATRFNELCINTRADYLLPTAANRFYCGDSETSVHTPRFLFPRPIFTKENKVSKMGLSSIVFEEKEYVGRVCFFSFLFWSELLEGFDSFDRFEIFEISSHEYGDAST